MKSFENNNFEPRKNESISEVESFKSVQIPIVDATLKECEKLENNPETLENIQSFLTEYFNEEIDNTEIYNSEKYGVAFPYTVVRLSDIAKKLYEKYGGQIKIETAFPEKKVHSHKEFIFGTFFNISSGHPYHWVEHGIDQISKKIPAALESLARGEEVEDFEIYGVGNPAGELGQVSDSFVDNTKDKQFEHLGEVYADFISSPQEENKNNNISSDIRLWGVSMGASTAMTTAESLLKNKQATQSFVEKDELQNMLPKIDVVMVSPVATSENLLRSYEIPLGFVAEFAIQQSNVYGRNVSKAEGDFTSMIYAKLRERGIEKHLSEEDKKIKTKYCLCL